MTYKETGRERMSWTWYPGHKRRHFHSRCKRHRLRVNMSQMNKNLKSWNHFCLGLGRSWTANVHQSVKWFFIDAALNLKRIWTFWECFLKFTSALIAVKFQLIDGELDSNAYTEPYRSRFPYCMHTDFSTYLLMVTALLQTSLDNWKLVILFSFCLQQLWKINQN